MTADEKLSQIRAKVNRAIKHLGDLEVVRDRVIKAKAYNINPKSHSETGHNLSQITDIKIDSDIGLIAGDVVHNLRSALDHLAYQLVISGGGTPGPGTYFPISSSATGYNKTFAGKVEGMRETAKDKITATKPYEGGTNELWWLHKLDIADKHHGLLVVPLHLRSASFEYFPGQGISAFPSGFGKPLKDGDVIVESEPGADKNTELKFEIAFAEPEAIKDFPLVEVLHKMLDAVDGLIISFGPELV